jgi:hypothetical protein
MPRMGCEAAELDPLTSPALARPSSAPPPSREVHSPYHGSDTGTVSIKLRVRGALRKRTRSLALRHGCRSGTGAKLGLSCRGYADASVARTPAAPLARTTAQLLPGREQRTKPGWRVRPTRASGFCHSSPPSARSTLRFALRGQRSGRPGMPRCECTGAIRLSRPRQAMRGVRWGLHVEWRASFALAAPVANPRTT